MRPTTKFVLTMTTKKLSIIGSASPYHSAAHEISPSFMLLKTPSFLVCVFVCMLVFLKSFVVFLPLHHESVSFQHISFECPLSIFCHLCFIMFVYIILKPSVFHLSSHSNHAIHFVLMCEFNIKELYVYK